MTPGCQTGDESEPREIRGFFTLMQQSVKPLFSLFLTLSPLFAVAIFNHWYYATCSQLEEVMVFELVLRFQLRFCSRLGSPLGTARRILYLPGVLLNDGLLGIARWEGRVKRQSRTRSSRALSVWT